MTLVTTKLYILTCRNFYREVAAWAADQKAADVIVQPFAAACLQPAVPEAGLRAAVRDHLQAGNHVALYGGRCLADLADLADGERTYLCTATTCAELAGGRQLTAAHSAAGAYVTTPGWLDAWEEVVAQDGLDRPAVRALLGPQVQRIVLFDTGVYEESARRLAAFADFCGLGAEHVPVGRDLLHQRLENLLLRFRLAAQREQSLADSAQASRQSADYAMLFDLISAPASPPRPKSSRRSSKSSRCCARRRAWCTCR